MTPAEAEKALRADFGRMSRDPLRCALYAFPWLKASTDLAEHPGPKQWQGEVLQTIGNHLKGPHWATPLLIAVASGHDIGKSALVGMITHWALSTCEDARVTVTANTGSQLDTKTIPEISKWFRLAINAHWWNVGAESIKVKEAAHEKTWRADFLTWSAERTESTAGLHNVGKRIVIIMDEASAIPDKIWEVFEGALLDENTEIIMLAFGNPTLNNGRFRECFGSLKHRWITRQIDSRSVPGTNKAQIAKWIADYGEDSDFVRVRVRGEFPRAGSAQFIPSDVVHEARKRHIPDEHVKHHWPILSVDVARFGDDRTTIGMRRGLKFTIHKVLRGKSVDQVAGHVMELMVELTPRSVIIDGDGIGGGVVDIIRQKMQPGEPMWEWTQRHPAFRLVEFHGAGSPRDPHMYFNLRAEMWGACRDWLKNADIPDDPELESDLTGPEYFFSSKNQIQLERKEDMKKRGLASPDLGDMLCYSFATEPLGKTQEERDQEKIQAAPTEMARRLTQYKVTMERQKALERAEERRPAHWD